MIFSGFPGSVGLGDFSGNNITKQTSPRVTHMCQKRLKIAENTVSGLKGGFKVSR
jgi:hypothetical protein